MDRRHALHLLSTSLVAAASDSLRPSLADAWQPGSTPRPDVELDLDAAPSEAAVVSGAPTRVWRYTASVVRGPATVVQPLPGSYLGPVLRLRTGQHVRVRFRNRLDEPSIVHWHGLDVPEAADGHPRLAVPAGGEYVYDFDVMNRAGTYWYHPHPHMRTGAQVYRGLAGVIVVSDAEEEALALPSGDAELVLVLQDRRIDAGNQFVYADGAATAGAGGAMRPGGMRGGMAAMMQTANGWLGDRVLVNGRPRPTLPVERRPYRLRLLNGSNARVYKLAWSDGTPFTILGGDGGLVERARQQSTLTLAPGQRADMLLDLSGRAAATSMTLRSLAFPAAAVGHVGMMGDTAPLPQGARIDLATLAIAGAAGARFKLPDRLCTAPPHWRAVEQAPERAVPLTFMRMEWLLGGRTFEMEAAAPDETVTAGSTHVWEFRNQPNPMGMAMAHPLHVHGTQFRVLSRTGAAGNPLASGLHDSPATDTVLVLPGETVRVQLTFSQYPGLYLYHCHVLEHEDMGMMRNFRIVPRPRG